MVNKDVELLFGEDVRVKVEELLDVALSEEEMKKAFSTTSKEIAEGLLQEASEVRNGIQEETFRDNLTSSEISMQAISAYRELKELEKGKEK